MDQFGYGGHNFNPYGNVYQVSGHVYDVPQGNGYQQYPATSQYQGNGTYAYINTSNCTPISGSQPPPYDCYVSGTYADGHANTQVNNHSNGYEIISNTLPPPSPPQYVIIDSQQRMPHPNGPQMQVNNNVNGYGMVSNTPPQYVPMPINTQQGMPHLNGPQMQSNDPNQNWNGNNFPWWTSTQHMPFDLKDYVSDEFFDTLDLFGLEQSITVTEQTFQLQYAGENDQSNHPAPSSSSPEGHQVSMECAICLEDMNSQNISSTPCGHLFCEACITEAVKKNNFCPMCKKAIQLNTLHRIYLPVQK